MPPQYSSLIDKLQSDYDANPDTFDLQGCDDIDELDLERSNEYGTWSLLAR